MVRHGTPRSGYPLGIIADDPAGHRALAERLFGAVAGGDVEAVRQCYSADLVLRNHAFGTDIDRDGIVAVVRQLAEAVPDLAYDDVVCSPTPTGFVQQHVLRGTARSGRAFAVPVCCVATVVDGVVVRLDEYADRARLLEVEL